ncbi:hypothetical protein ABEB36_000767 [Hypothenemus hampei]|uniref:Ninjurin-1 n=1 Tax=Hypothenemus hampei TaxID=57062 RepID=A0ABD1FE99_HYPHA
MEEQEDEFKDNDFNQSESGNENFIPNFESDNADVHDGIEKSETVVELIHMDELDDEEDSSENTRRVSLYGIAGKKTAAQGLMDIALLTSNANQLRYILEFNRKSHTFHITMTLIIISLTLQVAVAMLIIFKGRYYFKGKSKSVNAKRVKNYVLFCVFLVTVVNIFVASFTTMDGNVKAPKN